jgi:hypothetical protein
LIARKTPEFCIKGTNFELYKPILFYNFAAKIKEFLLKELGKIYFE